MSTLSIVLLVILVVLIIACVVLYFLGKKAEKKQAEQQEQLDAVAQTVSMLIIDKGKMKLKDSGLPQIVIDNTPKYLRRSKVPVVKAKVGPRIMTLMCDAQIYPLIPVKKEVKASDEEIFANPKYTKALTKYIVDDFKKSRIAYDDESIGGMIVCDSQAQARKKDFLPDLKKIKNKA